MKPLVNYESLMKLNQKTYIPTPTRQFQVGERVEVGYLTNCILLESLDDGKYLAVEHDAKRLKAGESSREISVRPWMDVFKAKTLEPDSLIRNKQLDLQFITGTIDGVLNRIYCDDLNFEAPYQRDYVWNLAQQEALIDSIFNHVEIGKVVLVERECGATEVLDGKQRILTLQVFFEDRLAYQGRRFSELALSDRQFFKNYILPVGILRTSDEQLILEQFI